MTIQTVDLGTAPTGAGGDTFRSAATKGNENFTNNTHAASRLVGTAAGNLMEVGAFGVGGSMVKIPMPSDDSNNLGSGYYYYDGNINANTTWKEVAIDIFIMRSNFANLPRGFEIGAKPYSNELYYRGGAAGGTGWRSPVLIRHSGNTTVDANGFIKAASPIIQLFADRIELNDEAAEQDITFEKVDIGHYLIKGSSGFSNNGWYIEMPKDANGNVLVAVVYEQLENKDISIQTYAKKFDEETGDIVANLEKPRDIPNGRWIDVRLNELPKAEIVMPEIQSEEATEVIADEPE